MLSYFYHMVIARKETRKFGKFRMKLSANNIIKGREMYLIQ